MPAVDAHPDREPPRPFDDVPQGEQHPLRIVPGGGRRAGGQDDLAAVVVDVAGQKGDPARVDGPLNVRDQLLEGLAHRRRPLGGEKPIHTQEVQEGDGDLAVLRLGVTRQDRLPDPHRYVPFEVVRAFPDVHDAFVDAGYGLPNENAGSFLVAGHPGRQGCGHLGRHHDLGGLRGTLHRYDPRGSRSGEDQLTVGIAHHEEVKGPAVSADRHLEAHPAGRGSDLAQSLDCILHADRGVHRPGLVVLLVEEQQQRIAAELDETAPQRVGDLHETPKALTEDLGDLLGSHLPESRQSFGHGGETGYVAEEHGPVDLAVTGLRRVRLPVQDEAGQIVLVAL